MPVFVLCFDLGRGFGRGLLAISVASPSDDQFSGGLCVGALSVGVLGVRRLMRFNQLLAHEFAGEAFA